MGVALLSLLVTVGVVIGPLSPVFSVGVSSTDDDVGNGGCIVIG